MQKINYKESIFLEDDILELLMINIDERLEQSNESDCIKMCGEIRVSGEVKTSNGNQSFAHPINVDILLSKEQLELDEVSLNVDDFNYQINKQTINIDLFMKINGLKEIEAYFPSQEDKEDVQIEELPIERDEYPIQEEIIEVHQEDDTIELTETKHYSLLSQIFKRKTLKTEPTYLLHVVKNETSYEEIASIYGIDINKIKSANKDEQIYKDKLVFIPKS